MEAMIAWGGDLSVSNILGVILNSSIPTLFGILMASLYAAKQIRQHKEKSLRENLREEFISAMSNVSYYRADIGILIQEDDEYPNRFIALWTTQHRSARSIEETKKMAEGRVIDPDKLIRQRSAESGLENLSEDHRAIMYVPDGHCMFTMVIRILSKGETSAEVMAKKNWWDYSIAIPRFGPGHDHGALTESYNQFRKKNYSITTMRKSDRTHVMCVLKVLQVLDREEILECRQKVIDDQNITMYNLKNAILRSR